MATPLDLNDGWTQIPPKEDGEYWFHYDKPWDHNGEFDVPTLVKIENGKRVAEMESGDVIWTRLHTDEDQKIWDGDSDHHGVAAWKKREPSESFLSPPANPDAILSERVARECRQCGGNGADYKVVNPNSSAGRPHYFKLFVCYDCRIAGELRDTEQLDAKNLENSIQAAIANAGD